MFSRMVLNTNRLSEGVNGLKGRNVRRRILADLQGEASGIVMNTYPSYLLIYALNGGVGVPANEPFIANVITDAAAQVPTKPGFTFQGWVNFPTTVPAVPYVDTLMPFNNFTVQATWL